MKVIFATIFMLFFHISAAHAQTYACYATVWNHEVIYIAYGSSHDEALNKVMKDCRVHFPESSGCTPGYELQCNLQEADPKAWSCKTPIYGTAHTFTSTGASRAEAFYRALSACYSAVDGSYYICFTGDVVCTHK